MEVTRRLVANANASGFVYPLISISGHDGRVLYLLTLLTTLTV